VFPVIFFLVQFESRYRFPTLWITFLLAAFALMGRRATIKDSPNVAF
jgi:hypothetical protein